MVGLGGVGARYDAGVPGAAPVTHASAWKAEPRVELVGGVDLDQQARAAFEQAWSAPAWGDIGEALDRARPDIVSVCTPAADRPDLIRTIADAGCRALWCEKPVAAYAAEARLVAEICDAAGLAVQVNYHRRFDPAHRRVAERLGGALVHADFRYTGTLADYGTHAIDLLRWYGGEIEWVHALPGREGEPAFAAATAAGVSALFAHVRADVDDVFEADLYAPRERTLLVGLGEEIVTRPIAESSLYPGYTRFSHVRAQVEHGLADAMRCGAAALVDHLLDGAPIACGIEDGIAAQAVVEAVWSSAENGARAIVSRV